MQIIIRLTRFRIQDHTKISCDKCPTFFTGSIPIIKSIKGITISILVFKLTKIVYKILIMLIIMTKSRRCRHPGSSPNNNSIRVLNVSNQRIYCLFILFLFHNVCSPHLFFCCYFITNFFVVLYHSIICASSSCYIINYIVIRAS